MTFTTNTNRSRILLTLCAALLVAPTTYAVEIIKMPGATTSSTSTKSVAPTATTKTLSTCLPNTSLNAGIYWAENDTWGMGTTVGWTQCITAVITGINNVSNVAPVTNWTWSWPVTSPNRVQAYPSSAFGYFPDGMTNTLLPRQISGLTTASIDYNISSTHTGMGDTAFDIWLTNTATPTTFAAPPITNEVMIWLESFGNMSPGGTFLGQAVIDNVTYNVWNNPNQGLGWNYTAFQRVVSQVGVGRINLLSFLTYMQNHGLVNSATYLSSVLIGNEVINGTGSTYLNSYSIAIQ